MAKKVGAEEAAKTVKGSGAKPAPGTTEPTNQVVTQESFIAAVQEIENAANKVKVANDALKSVKLKWKASGIAITTLGAMVKIAKGSRGEARDHFQTVRKYAEWLGLPVEGRTARMFEGLTDDQVQAKEWFSQGRTYSRTGQPGKPPEECPPEFHQAFMRGFNEEDEAAWSDADSDRTADAGDPVVDQQAAGEGAPPEADPSLPTRAIVGLDDQPSWVGFGDEPDDWFADHKRIFAKWFEALPASAIVRISHQGVLKAFRKARDEERAALPAGEVDESPVLDGEEEPEPAALTAQAEPPSGDAEAEAPPEEEPPAEATPSTKGKPKGKGGEAVH